MNYTALSDIAFAPSLSSPVEGVSDLLWTAFVRAMITSRLEAVSDSNALGMFEMMPRRLHDLGLVENLRRRPSRTGGERTIWVGNFVKPLTEKKFLRSPEIQYRVFEQSIVDYAQRISSGEIDKDPDMSLSGALAILHRCGPRGLETWAASERFPATADLYAKAAELF